MQVIKNHEVINDSWHLAANKRLNASYPIASEFNAEKENHILLDYITWKGLIEPLRAQFHGIVLTCHESVNVQPEELHHLDLIAIDLAKADPSLGMSLVKHLREALGYKSEIRAINVDAKSTTAAIKSGFDSIELNLTV